MKLLNLDSGDEAAPPNKKKSKWLKIGIGLSALVLIPTIGSTLAGSININAGSGVEFGQGVVSTAACDGTITVAPTSELTNSVPPSLPNGSMPGVAPYFSLGAIEVSDINGATCDPVTFIIRAYDSNGASTPLCSNAEPELYVFFDSSTYGYISESCGSFSYTDPDVDQSGDGSFEWLPDLTELYLDASSVNTITIESSSLPCDVAWCD